MGLDVFNGVGLHDIVDEEAAVSRSREEVRVSSVEEDVHGILVDVVAGVLLELDAGGGFDEA